MISLCAALIFETPPTLQLTFEPAGKPGKDREYYLVQKENICVVCGYSKDCIRKNIVPQEYRKLDITSWSLMVSGSDPT